MKLIKILSSISMVLLITLSVKGQECKCSEETVTVQNEPISVLRMIEESDYPYFLNVDSLRRYSNIKYDGLSVKSSKVKRYVLTNSSKHVKLNAVYGKNGNLINGKLLIIDSPLPVVIREYLNTDMFKDWTIKRNKILVHDFDTRRTEYEVQVQHQKMNQTLFFDYSGNRIKRLSRL